LSLSSSGLLSGTAPGDVTTVNFLVSVTDATHTTSTAVAFSLTVSAGTTKVSLTPDPAPAVGSGVSVDYSATVTEATGSGVLTGTLTFAINGIAVASCTNLVLNANQASCSTSFPTSGKYTVTATYASDPNFSGSSNSLSQSVTSESTKPAITSLASASATVGTLFNFTVTSTGSPTPTITESGKLPAGLSFVANSNGTATLSGTPAAGSGGSYKITWRATSSAGSASQSFVLLVDQPPAITSVSSATASVGRAFSFIIKSSGYPTASISESGALPNGVSFDSNSNGTATLAGTPAAGSGGTYNLVITATNAIGTPAVQDFVLGVDQPAAITSLASASATVGTLFNFTVTSIGTPTPTITESGKPPAGLSFVANSNGTATLAGTPAAGSGGSYKITWRASSSAGSATQSFVLVIDQPAAITSASSVSARVGKHFNFTVKTSGYPTTSISESGALPNGVSFVVNNNGTATLSGTPASGSAASYALTITATNAVGASAMQSFVLDVSTS
jgi:hypothetical protein